MSYPPRTIDAAEAILKASSWSVGDVAYRGDHGIVWLVTCIRGEERVVTEADSQLAAWKRAVENAAGHLLEIVIADHRADAPNLEG